MAKQGGLYKIQSLRRCWITYRVLEYVLLSVIAGLFVGTVVHYMLLSTMVWGIITFFIVLTILLAVNRPWQMSEHKIASFLNKHYPQLQESSQLLLLPTENLNALQLIAASRIDAAVTELKVSHRLFAKRLMAIFLTLIVLIALIIALSKMFNAGHIFYKQNRPVAQCAPTRRVMEKVLPQVSTVNIIITPPAYTYKAKREQDKFNLSAEEGAITQWRIKTNVNIKKAYLLFNSKEQIALQAGPEKNTWYASKTITSPGFYQVSIDGKLSDLYDVQIIKDSAPVIHIKTPKQYTYIDAGEAPRVTVNASLNDDYGVSDAVIMATVAKGRGEGVKFKDYKLKFAQGFSGHNTQYNVQKLIELPSLNVEPGDELYFYIQAQDTHKQLSRTDVFTVSVQDTAELLSMNGMINGSNLKPEFFRSERQIIIDAEQLLKERDTISIERFNSRSNNLGIDQKLLRLRYGKFLGEEGEDVIGATGNAAADPADFSNAAKILKEYTDDHDNAEDAGFFEPGVKAQLKATLTEMWKAELQLRLYKPHDALPFAYKALRLLKDLQQKSRAFVAKTAYNPPPLKQEKRLSGELDKIIQPVSKQVIKPVDGQLAALTKAVGILEALKINPALSVSDTRILQVANQQLGSRASAQPGVFLPALNAMRRILSSSKANNKDVGLVETALQKALATLENMPAADAITVDMGLSKQYFKNLKQANR